MGLSWLTIGLLATLDDGASENVASPYGTSSWSSPESSKVAKAPRSLRLRRDAVNRVGKRTLCGRPLSLIS